MQYTKTKVVNMNSILTIVLKRLLIGLLTLWIVTVIIFAAIELLPGDIATEMLGQAATEESVAAFRDKFDLNGPLHVRYFSWLAGAATGDFGISLVSLAHKSANFVFESMHQKHKYMKLNNII